MSRFGVDISRRIDNTRTWRDTLFDIAMGLVGAGILTVIGFGMLLSGYHL